MIEVISKIVAKKDKVDELIAVFKEMIEPTKEEKGYIKYEMYQDIKEPDTLIVLEQWEGQDDFDNHCKSRHFELIVPRMVECMEKESEVNICSRVA